MRARAIVAAGLTVLIAAAVASADVTTTSSVRFVVSGGTKRDAKTGVLIYGGSVALIGAVKGARHGIRVTIVTRRFGAAPMERDLPTAADGSFSFSDVPAIASRYEVRVEVRGRLRFRGEYRVLVGPRLALTSPDPKHAIFAVSTRTPHSFAGSNVVIQRRFSLQDWRPIKRVQLGTGSAARFRLHLPRGHTVLRAVLPAAEAGPGYTYGLSNIFFFTRA
jgi:hypothetical protein